MVLGKYFVVCVLEPFGLIPGGSWDLVTTYNRACSSTSTGAKL